MTSSRQQDYQRRPIIVYRTTQISGHCHIIKWDFYALGCGVKLFVGSVQAVYGFIGCSSIFVHIHHPHKFGKMVAKGCPHPGFSSTQYTTLRFGILGQFHGIYQALKVISMAQAVSPPIIWGGLAVSFSSTLAGLGILLIAALLWAALRSGLHRRERSLRTA